MTTWILFVYTLLLAVILIDYLVLVADNDVSKYIMLKFLVAIACLLFTLINALIFGFAILAGTPL